MLYLHEENGKYYLPHVIWNMIKEYTGIYHIENVTLTRTMPLDNMYSLYRMWFGRFTLPDEYDICHRVPGATLYTPRPGDEIC